MTMSQIETHLCMNTFIHACLLFVSITMFHGWQPGRVKAAMKSHD